MTWRRLYRSLSLINRGKNKNAVLKKADKPNLLLLFLRLPQGLISSLLYRILNMNYFGLPQVYTDMLKELDKSGMDYLTILEPKGNQWYVERYIIRVDSSKRVHMEHALAPLVDKFDSSIKKQDNSLLICSITK